MLKLMRQNPESFNNNIGSWDVSNVVNMSSMFWDAKSFNGNIGGWDVSNVTDMSRMFERAISFNQDIGKWDVSNVNEMEMMILESITMYTREDIEKWNIGKKAKELNQIINNL